MTELEKIKQAFEKWCKEPPGLAKQKAMSATMALYLASGSEQDRYFEGRRSASYHFRSPKETAELFWPFVAMYFARQRDPKQGVSYSEMYELYRLKAKLGMPLKAHEVVGDD